MIYIFFTAPGRSPEDRSKELALFLRPSAPLPFLRKDSLYCSGAAATTLAAEGCVKLENLRVEGRSILRTFRARRAKRTQPFYTTCLRQQAITFGAGRPRQPSL